MSQAVLDRHPEVLDVIDRSQAGRTVAGVLPRRRQTTVRLIGLSGYSRCGKDTAAAFLVREGWVQRSIIDGLRHLLLEADPWLPDGTRWGDRYRTLGYRKAKDCVPGFTETMVNFGQVARTVFGSMIWANQMLDSILPGERTVVADCRMPEEAEAIRRQGGLIVRIDRPGVGPGLDLHGKPFVTDVALDDYTFDARIVNDGTTEELGAAVLALTA
jgi:hypothetical protein